MNFLLRIGRQLVFVVIFLELLILIFYFGLPKLLIKDLLVRAEVTELETELELYGQDWFPPVVGINDASRTISYSKSEFSLSSNEKIESSELPDGWKLSGETSSNDNYYYILSTGTIKDGKHEYSLGFSDKAGNETTRKVKIEAKSGRSSITEWTDFLYSAYPYDLLVPVSKKHKLSQDFVPPNLVSLSSLGIANNNDAHLQKNVANELKKMTDQISAAGINYTVTSAYRSYAQQASAYNYWMGFYAGNTSETDLVSARPGFSEHQLGTTLDFVTSANGNIFYGFEYTALSNWLAENAYKYGFVLSYPQGKTDITGYIFEPWHYRYVGKENAAEFRKSGLTLIEWLTK